MPTSGSPAVAVQVENEAPTSSGATLATPPAMTRTDNPAGTTVPRSSVIIGSAEGPGGGANATTPVGRLAPVSNLPPLRVLILDDAAFAELAVAALKEVGYTCEWERADSREAFLARLSESKYDLILADYSLPAIDGMTALRLFCEHQVDIPFIIVSGVLGEERAIEAVKAGATDYVLKARLARLGTIVQRALQEKEEQRERRHAEAALRRSEERFRIVAQGTHDAVWDWDLVTDGVERNESFLEIFGYTPDQVEATRAWWQDRIHPDDRERVVSGIRALIDGGGHAWSAEYRFLRGDGSFAYVFDRGHVIHDRSGKPVRMIGARMDITARQQAAEEIRGLNESLERRVRERTAQLEVANAELETFSYSVSHDLRAPLRAIKGFSKVLLEDYAAKFDEQGKDCLERVCANILRMDQLIEDLLKLSQVSRHNLERASVDLSALAQSITADLQQRQPGRVATFVIADGLQANGDPHLLRVLLENLLGNAWKYTSKHAAARIELGVTVQEGERVCFVRDDGAGFDMTFADKLFVPFQRLHGPAEFEGTGIGLATVYRIIRRHGGRVWAEGAPEQGATFYFTLEA